LEERLSALLHPEQVLRAWKELWTQTAREGAENGGVLRACTMTLVVSAVDQADALQTRRTVGLLMKDHPSRAIILHPGGGDAIEAQEFAECLLPSHGSARICVEGIDVAMGRAGPGKAARFVDPLLAPDLPVVLWCRGAAALESGVCAPLYSLAHKIIFDSRGAPDAGAALRALRRLHVHGYRVADLHWARLTGWREVLAHVFERLDLRAGDVRAASVGFGGADTTTCALYFEAWLRSSFPKVPVSSESGAGEPGVTAVRLATSQGDLRLRRGEPGAIAVDGPGFSYRAALPPATEEALMREELGIMGLDPVYERVLIA
jgi:glucose-6-phosphate dehydrogenase assembly protein OpcA